MVTVKSIKMYLKNPRKLIIRIGRDSFLRLISDEAFLKFAFYANTGRKLNLKNPKTFNEKLQWLKLYNRKPEYTRMVDKYEAKKYAAEIIGEEHIIPTLGVWDKFEDIDFNKMPNQFVLKCTHDSGGLVICRDKSQLDILEVRKKINRSLKRNFFWSGREWPYKNVKPRIIAEQYMEDQKTKELRDYKFFTFDGFAKVFYIVTDHKLEPKEERKLDFFDMDLKHLDLKNGYRNAETPPSIPERFEEMKTMAEKLSKGIPHVRVDIYEVNGSIYFGEMTFFHIGGMSSFEPEEWDESLGELIKLPGACGGGYLIYKPEILIWLHEISATEKNLNVYKFFSFNGEPKLIQAIQNDKTKDETIDYFDCEWNLMKIKQNYPNSSIPLPPPGTLTEMLGIVKKLSTGFPFLRVDLYEINGGVYFSEFTFFSDGGMASFEPEEWDEVLGDWLNCS